VAWALHRALYSVSGGRRGLGPPKDDHYGTLRLHTVGRKTGKERIAIVGYKEDGPNLVTVAMNGWSDPEPAWWLNLQAHPEATVDLHDGPRAVTGRRANADEQTRVFKVAKDVNPYAALRSRDTTVVILEPRRDPRLNDSGRSDDR
jgi:deazaflavin-dependent oxidoreductase (nitroreductase family)